MIRYDDYGFGCHGWPSAFLSELSGWRINLLKDAWMTDQIVIDKAYLNSLVLPTECHEWSTPTSVHLRSDLRLSDGFPSHSPQWIEGVTTNNTTVRLLSRKSTVALLAFSWCETRFSRDLFQFKFSSNYYKIYESRIVDSHIYQGGQIRKNICETYEIHKLCVWSNIQP